MEKKDGRTLRELKGLIDPYSYVQVDAARVARLLAIPGDSGSTKVVRGAARTMRELAQELMQRSDLRGMAGTYRAAGKLNSTFPGELLECLCAAAEAGTFRLDEGGILDHPGDMYAVTSYGETLKWDRKHCRLYRFDADAGKWAYDPGAMERFLRTADLKKTSFLNRKTFMASKKRELRAGRGDGSRRGNSLRGKGLLSPADPDKAAAILFICIAAAYAAVVLLTEPRLLAASAVFLALSAGFLIRLLLRKKPESREVVPASEDAPAAEVKSENTSGNVSEERPAGREEKPEDSKKVFFFDSPANEEEQTEDDPKALQNLQEGPAPREHKYLTGQQVEALANIYALCAELPPEAVREAGGSLQEDEYPHVMDLDFGVSSILKTWKWKAIGSPLYHPGRHSLRCVNCREQDLYPYRYKGETLLFCDRCGQVNRFTESHELQHWQAQDEQPYCWDKRIDREGRPEYKYIHRAGEIKSRPLVDAHTQLWHRADAAETMLRYLLQAMGGYRIPPAAEVRQPSVNELVIRGDDDSYPNRSDSFLFRETENCVKLERYICSGEDEYDRIVCIEAFHDYTYLRISYLGEDRNDLPGVIELSPPPVMEEGNWISKDPFGLSGYYLFEYATCAEHSSGFEEFCDRFLSADAVSEISYDPELI